MNHHHRTAARAVGQPPPEDGIQLSVPACADLLRVPKSEIEALIAVGRLKLNRYRGALLVVLEQAEAALAQADDLGGRAGR